jgi:hypothetical protein
MDSYNIIAGNKPRFPHANIATTSPISLFVFVCARLRVFYFRNILHIQFAEPDRPPDTAQHNARSATQHSPRTNSHTQSTYRKISAIVQFKKRTRFPFPCQPRFLFTSTTISSTTATTTTTTTTTSCLVFVFVFDSSSSFPRFVSPSSYLCLRSCLRSVFVSLLSCLRLVLSSSLSSTRLRLSLVLSLSLSCSSGVGGTREAYTMCCFRVCASSCVRFWINICV